MAKTKGLTLRSKVTYSKHRPFSMRYRATSPDYGGGKFAFYGATRRAALSRLIASKACISAENKPRRRR